MLQRIQKGLLLLGLVSGTALAAPTTSLTAPATNTVYTAPGTVTLTATASPANNITKVEFYQGTTLIGTDTTSPYSITWSNVAAGSYSLTAKAIDKKGDTGTSTAVPIVVNAPPTVALTSPTANQVVTAPASFTLAANATDSTGTISKVEFFQGSTLIGTVTTAPYSITWSNVAAGTYSLTVKATDSYGAVTTSSAVSVTSNAAPTVSLSSPANNAAYTAPGSLTLTANAADSDGTLTQVAFYQNGQLLGTDTSAPYTYDWTNVQAGSYSLTAQATDNRGAVTTSGAIAIGVYDLPTVSMTAPANNSVVPAPATVTLTANASAASGRTITQVAFYQGTTLIGTDTGAPYTFDWANVSAGTYSLTAQATDDLGAVTTSASATLTVNAAPNVSFTAPADNASYIAPATIALTANATDSDGSIAQVEFYEGANLLATVTTAPYTYDWSNVQPGNYTLFAKVTDNHGAATTGTAIHITVAANQAPTINITAPAPGTSYTTPASIHLTASASDADGSITQVAFYQNNQLLSTVTTAPYAYDWTDVQPGTYQITAQATDDRNLTTTSAPLTITVTTAIPQAYYIHTDQLDTPRAITNASNTVVWRWDSDPFGTTAANADPDGNNQQFEYNERFPGQYYDQETNLHYNYFRDYDPTTGRYIESDPIGLGGGLNTYAYVDGNPLDTVDPYGLAGMNQPTMEEGSTSSGAGIPGLEGIGIPLSTIGQSGLRPGSINGPVGGVSKLPRACPPVAKKAPDITTPYKRPSGATTKAQRDSVQNQPCVDCGNIANKQVADHKTPLVKEYYETGAIDRTKMRSLDAVQPQCPTCSARQGAEMSRYSKQQKKELGL